MENFVNSGKAVVVKNGELVADQQPRKSPTYLKFVEHASNQRPSPSDSESMGDTNRRPGAARAGVGS